MIGWRSKISAAFVIAALLIAPSFAETFTSSIRVVDMSPQFLAFYEKAALESDPARRFELWKEHYDFVALPPNLPDRDERARALLDAAWPKYAGVKESLQGGISSLSAQTGPLLGKVAELFDIGDAVPPITLLYYVGMFEGNAFFGAQPDGSLVIGVPAESAGESLEISMAHELAHALHHSVSNLAVGPEGSVADLVMSEGIAMHTTRTVFPERSDHLHIGGSEEWLATCDERIPEILRALSTKLESRGPAEVNRLTVGMGLTGMEREGYCAGWHLVGHLLDHGATLAGLVRMSEREAINALSQAIVGLEVHAEH